MHLGTWRAFSIKQHVQANVKVLMDTRGPEIRTGKFEAGDACLSARAVLE